LTSLQSRAAFLIVSALLLSITMQVRAQATAPVLASAAREGTTVSLELPHEITPQWGIDADWTAHVAFSRRPAA
jgi:hypothetical protein